MSSYHTLDKGSLTWEGRFSPVCLTGLSGAATLSGSLYGTSVLQEVKVMFEEEKSGVPD